MSQRPRYATGLDDLSAPPDGDRQVVAAFQSLLQRRRARAPHAHLALTTTAEVIAAGPGRATAHLLLPAWSSTRSVPVPYDELLLELGTRELEPGTVLLCRAFLDAAAAPAVDPHGWRSCPEPPAAWTRAGVRAPTSALVIARTAATAHVALDAWCPETRTVPVDAALILAASGADPQPGAWYTAQASCHAGTALGTAPAGWRHAPELKHLTPGPGAPASRRPDDRTTHHLTSEAR
ncbi:hypothetical protein ACFWXO_16405 [Kitasatospora sp. NPDC059088]|uniref:hypothetical protein n=1 Tax=Kitasatospora sp. NPDC059088 TaxID=3346722 RepID=UPI0036770E4D